MWVPSPWPDRPLASRREFADLALPSSSSTSAQIVVLVDVRVARESRIVAADHQVLLGGKVLDGVAEQPPENLIDPLFAETLIASRAQLIDDSEELLMLPVDHRVASRKRRIPIDHEAPPIPPATDAQHVRCQLEAFGCNSRR
jgi:hypothetical protein